MQELLPRLPCKHGRLKAALELWWAYPYSASAHSWPPPSSRAVRSAIKSLDCRVSSPVFTMQIRSTESTTAVLPSPLSSGATQGVHSATVCRSSEPSESAPSAHPDVCAESRSLEVDAHDRHSLSRDAVPADRCIGTGRHPSAASHRRGYLPSACLLASTPTREPMAVPASLSASK